jgi:hypothetical protein
MSAIAIEDRTTPELVTEPEATPILVISQELQDHIEHFKWELIEKLVVYKIPKENWHQIWTRLDGDDPVFGEADEDLDVQSYVWFFRGVALALGADEQEIVSL